jgi:hypothetical protein
MSKITELSSAQLTATDTITIELVEADETPAVVIVRWPAKPTVSHPRRFPDTAAVAARVFAEAATRLAQLKVQDHRARRVVVLLGAHQRGRHQRLDLELQRRPRSPIGNAQERRVFRDRGLRQVEKG